MTYNANVIEYKCPCCDAGLVFGGEEQQLTCAYCDNTFDIETVRAYNESESAGNTEDVQWDQTYGYAWTEEEQRNMRSFQCPSCGGELITDEHTAATFCPYCGNPTILPGRVSGGLKPHGIIPFKTTKEDAKAAFLSLCKGKPLLPKFFTQEQQVEKITGMYVPFWLYHCSGDINGSYKATRVHHWSDSNYNYTRTDHFLLRRAADASFAGIPMDGSSKMDDTFMESIEPYDYGELAEFDTAYLSGFLTDKYDVSAEKGEDRIRERVGGSFDQLLQSSFVGYASVLPSSRQLNITHSQAQYVLMPVWLLNTKYNGKTYTFAMNGQTGKMTGAFPICPKRTAAWFGAIATCVTAVAAAVQLLMG